MISTRFTRSALSFACAALVVLCASVMVFATMIPQSVEQLTANSSHIIRGEVTSIQSQWNERRTTIYTTVTVTTSNSFKSSTPTPNNVTISFPGGEADGMKLWVEHAPEFAIGEEVILFLEDNGTSFSVTSWEQGKYTVVNNLIRETGQDLSVFVDRISSAVAAEQQNKK